MSQWLAVHGKFIAIWCGALCTLAIYSVLYSENKFYRLFEHIFIGLGTGYGVYATWKDVLAPKWWLPMTHDGAWYWAFAAVAGSMFYFMYSQKHVWISRVIFGFFMGVAAGGIFRAFYELYFPQIGSSMKPLAPGGHWGWGTASAVLFYVILFSAMTYFFFSFEHKHPTIVRTAQTGRWFLMIGFGAIFGATVMGRLTLLIGRLNFMIQSWFPQARRDTHAASLLFANALWFRVTVIALAVVVAWLLFRTITRRTKPKDASPEG